MEAASVGMGGAGLSLLLNFSGPPPPAAAAPPATRRGCGRGKCKLMFILAPTPTPVPALCSTPGIAGVSASEGLDDASDPESNSSHEPVHESLEHEDAGDADDTWWCWLWLWR